MIDPVSPLADAFATPYFVSSSLIASRLSVMTYCCIMLRISSR